VVREGEDVLVPGCALGTDRGRHPRDPTPSVDGPQGNEEPKGRAFAELRISLHKPGDIGEILTSDLPFLVREIGRVGN